MRSGFVVVSLRLGVLELAAHVSLREEDVCLRIKDGEITGLVTLGSLDPA